TTVASSDDLVMLVSVCLGLAMWVVILLHDRGFRLGVTDFRETFGLGARSRSSTPAIRTVSPSTTAGDEMASAASTIVSLIIICGPWPAKIVVHCRAVVAEQSARVDIIRSRWSNRRDE